MWQGLWRVQGLGIRAVLLIRFRDAGFIAIWGLRNLSPMGWYRVQRLGKTWGFGAHMPPGAEIWRLRFGSERNLISLLP